MIYLIIAAIFVIFGLLIWWKSPRFFHTINLAELIPDALLIVDRDGKILRANNNAARLFGYTKSELYAKTVEDLMPERYRDMHKHLRKEFKNDAKTRPMGMGRDLSILTKDGREIPTEIALSPSSQNVFSNYCREKIIVLLHDITDRKEKEDIIHNLAYYDQLTHLPNRTSFYKEAQPIIDAVGARGDNLAFMLIDIRELKKINDTLGHYVGDDVIQRTGMILKGCMNDEEFLKNTCITKMHLYNISGNEFAFFVEYDKDGTQCIEDLALYIINVFKVPAIIEGQSLDMHININIGISIFPVHGMVTSQLLKTADIALINSKQQGKNCFGFYNHALKTEFHNFITYENAIKYFIQTNDFNISYQPVWNIKQEKYVGAEVLFRCNEDIYPNMHVDFLINVAESTGLIVPLGAAILERACEETNKFDLTCNELVISVNASIQQLEDDKFTDKVCDILERKGIDPNRFAIEITETTLMNREAQAIEKVKELRENGILIYIDDFGKGFSSLSYLQKIPADKLKIDMSFLDETVNDHSRIEILRGIIALGHAIEMVVCSEGVETQQQLNLLEELGCDEIQGFYRGDPMSAEKLKELYSEMFTECNTPILEHKRNNNL